MSQNGRLPGNDLAVIPGGRLRKDAAGAWLAMRARIGREQGVWICPTSQRTAYRPLADQQYFWSLFQSGRGALAARPGTSNHGWGIAVDLPTPAMQAAVRKYGHEFGWGIQGGKLTSDAPSECWHSTFHPGVYKGRPAPKYEHPYQSLTPGERAARDVLVKERRVAKRSGGWEKIDRSHRDRAMIAKAKLKLCARRIAAAAAESGWDKFERRRRYDYISKLIDPGEESVAPPGGDDEGVQDFPAPDSGLQTSDEPDPAFGETADEEAEMPSGDEPDPEPLDDLPEDEDEDEDEAYGEDEQA